MNAFGNLDPTVLYIIATLTAVVVRALKTSSWFVGGRTVAAAAVIGMTLGAVSLCWVPAITPQRIAEALVTGVFGGLASVGIRVVAQVAQGKGA
jgi:hypothetical protein